MSENENEKLDEQIDEPLIEPEKEDEKPAKSANEKKDNEDEKEILVYKGKPVSIFKVISHLSALLIYFLWYLVPYVLHFQDVQAL